MSRGMSPTSPDEPSQRCEIAARCDVTAKKCPSVSAPNPSWAASMLRLDLVYLETCRAMPLARHTAHRVAFTREGGVLEMRLVTCRMLVAV